MLSEGVGDGVIPAGGIVAGDTVSARRCIFELAGGKSPARCVVDVVASAGVTAGYAGMAAGAVCVLSAGMLPGRDGAVVSLVWA